jgi:hypothetical protein
MKVIASIYTSTNNPDWSALNFKPYRNEDKVLVFPESRWIETALIAELDIKVGDSVE